MEMDFDYPTRVKLAITLLVSSLLYIDIRLARDTVTFDMAFINHDEISQLETRYKDLKEILPSHGTIGYMTDFSPSLLDIDDVVAYDKVKAEYRSLQYVLSPLVLKPVTLETAHTLRFIINSARESVSNHLISRTRIFVLIEDFGHGVRLYGKAPD
jgi:hypothetical protein